MLVKNRVIIILFSLGAFSLLLNCAAHVPPLIQIPELLQFDVPKPKLEKRRPLPSKVYPLVSISAVGDLMMGSWIVNLLRTQGYDYPFDSTRVELYAGDLAIANLEAPFTSTGTKFEKKYNFKVPPDFAIGVKNAGIDVVTLANNHTLDYGCEGLINTLATLDSIGIAHCGAGENRMQACSPTIIERLGVRVAFVGFSMTFPEEFWASDTSCGTCYPSETSLAATIRQCEQKADLTVASFHWSAERRSDPKEYQKVFAHIAIDNGADLVLGHHPHVLQGIEIYKNRLIAYSLGNYVFGSYGNYVRHSAILKVHLAPDRLLSAEIVPISVYNAKVEFQPKILRGRERSTVITELRELSRSLNGDLVIIDDEGHIIPGSKSEMVKLE